MKIAVDMDEVIADLLEQYILFLNTEQKLKLLREQFTGYYTWTGWNGTVEEKIQSFSTFYKSPYFFQVLPVAAAAEALATIKKDNELYIVTSRPDSLKDATISWIEQYYPDTFTDIYFADYVLKKKKSDICKQLGATYIIEDSLDYARDCAAHNTNAVLLTYPWNSAEQVTGNITRVKSWEEIPALLMK